MREARVIALLVGLCLPWARPAAAEVLALDVGVHSSCPYGLVP